MEPLHLGLLILALIVAVVVFLFLARRRRGAPPDQLPEPEPKPEPEPEPVDDKARVKSIRKGLKATRGGFIKKLKALFKGKSDLDLELEDRIEEVFITSDVGARTAHEFIARLKKALSSEELADPAKVWGFVQDEARRILAQPTDPPGKPEDGPLTILVLGVNGVGKTTTIGKLASLYKSRGKSVVLGAADTFRAAAVEQLEVWGRRIDAPVVRGKEGADPSSVVFDALKQAQAGAQDVVIIDTAGRLHTKTPLMEELKKLRRVMGKAQPGAPHEVLLVLDATTGQNGVMQARSFLESLEVTGIVLTKLDGTAKGGVILGIGSELHIPVRYIGVGEGIEDLRPFDPDEFVEALFDEIDEEEAAA
jgi:fused signal recognition particle receptor